jgi:hypothetical protein
MEGQVCMPGFKLGRRSLDDTLQQLAAGAARGREDDDLNAKAQSKTGAEDCDAAHAQQKGVSLSHETRREFDRGADTHLYVLPNRRGVLIKTSELDLIQPYFSITIGRSVSQSPL